MLYIIIELFFEFFYLKIIFIIYFIIQKKIFISLEYIKTFLNDPLMD